jgi:hypothetical protein
LDLIFNAILGVAFFRVRPLIGGIKNPRNGNQKKEHNARTAQTSDALQEELRSDSNTKWRTECVTPSATNHHP